MERDATPERPRIGVVVGEGHRARRGLLRFVLEGEGFRVLGEAGTAAELVQALSVHHPDAVVLDDGIGPTAVAVTREMRPDAKVVLVWPPALVPISGDATVDPSLVLRDLGPAVERACGLPLHEPASATVRSLPRRDPRSHPSAGATGAAGLTAVTIRGPGVARKRGADDEPIVIDREPAPVLILPVSRVVPREPRS